jgi:hypothetical protein
VRDVVHDKASAGRERDGAPSPLHPTPSRLTRGEIYYSPSS